MVYLIQVIGGNPLIGYANYFFEQAGLNPANAFNSRFLGMFCDSNMLIRIAVGVGNTALGFVGTCMSFVLLNYVRDLRACSVNSWRKLTPHSSNWAAGQSTTRAWW